MHVIFRENHGLEETETPIDLGQDPADLVVLSFSDSDLGAFASGWHRAGGSLPTLRLANLVGLKHPLSVDTYLDNTLIGAKGILIRLIGGAQYWSYGISQVNRLAQDNNIALAVLPADGRPDARLDELSTLPVATLRRLSALCDAGGAVAAQAALAQLALAAGEYAGPVSGDKTVPEVCFYDPHDGVLKQCPEGDAPLVVVTFYRSYLTAADTGPVDALIIALRQKGFRAVGLAASSLKAPNVAAWISDALGELEPSAVVNMTAFSAQGADGAASPLDMAGCPVFQVSLSTARRSEWAEAERGLSPADLAMHVVLPEVDGRLFSGVVSFKVPQKRDPDLQYSRFAHSAADDRIASVVEKVAAWCRLGATPCTDKQVALVLSTYPGKLHQMAHAVGLDALASTDAILDEMVTQGYNVPDRVISGNLGPALEQAVTTWSVGDYKAVLATLPAQLQDDLNNAWGAPETDMSVVDGAFEFRTLSFGKTLVALQPERGDVARRDDDYHDLSRVPRHSYVAFYLWLRAVQTVDVLVHIGAHGTLEWLPGKSVALSSECWPEVLIGSVPVVYPFIVNDPGEAAQAKRRTGAVTLGHLPPVMTSGAVPDGLLQLEHLLDEYSTADGLDPARRERLVKDIREHSEAAGVDQDLGLKPEMCETEALTRIDRFVCDLKESQFGDGLHVFGNGECGADERYGLTAALNGRRVDAGPSGSPYRGKSDVMPTGRNIFSVDPRSVPTQIAYQQGKALAEEVLRRHLQDEGDWPRSLVVDLWGSATMRTAGEEFAMALFLAGAEPTWDAGSSRVSGFEVIPLAQLGRPRIDVTLRMSGLFRDAFSGLAQMFGQVSTALSQRDEELADNPYLQTGPRVFGPRPGLYGVGMTEMLDDFTPEARQAAGEAWLTASEWAFDARGEAAPARGELEERVASTEGYVHVQDLLETDLLLGADYATHEGGFAAAVKSLGKPLPALWHLDTTRPDAPTARTMPEEIARVVRGRAANPAWADGMMRHGYRGAAEIASTLDHLAAFSHLAGVVPPHLFDLYYDATLGRDELREFMKRENPLALAAMEDVFRRLREADLWKTRRNSIVAELEAAS